MKSYLSKPEGKNLLSVLISVFILVTVYSISQSSVVLYTLNKEYQNLYYAIKNNITDTRSQTKPVADDIIVLEIDDKTLKVDKENLDKAKELNPNIDRGEFLWRFPFDRKAYAPVIKRLHEAGAAVVAFDIIFTEETNLKSDSIMRKAIKDADNVLIGSFFTPDGTFNKSIFAEEIKATWFFTPMRDEVNEVVYSIRPFTRAITNEIVDHFSFSILKYYLGVKNINSDDYYYQLTRKRFIPYASPGSKDILINYVNYKKFRNNKVSFIDVYDEKRFEELKQYKDFSGKIVLIWITITWNKDIFNTPNGTDYGVYVHANMINTVLKWQFLSYFNETYEWLLIFLLIIISVYFNLSRSGIVLIFSNIAVFSIFLLIFPIAVIYSTNLIINFPTELIFALFLSLVSSNIIKYIIENRHKQKLSKALWEYVSKDIATEILSWAGKVNLEGENKRIAIFFSDIEWFTTISEKFSPEDLVHFLREYLGDMSNIILDERWFINKYEWDAIMALWGVFSDAHVLDSYRACKSALAQQKKLKTLNIEWSKRGFSEIKARIGINTGSAIIWNIGAEGRKMEFTALWDSVNLASRLEGVNKFYWTYICVSEETYNEVNDKFIFRYLDKIRVKWKNLPIKIYELICFAEENYHKELYSDFEKAIRLYEWRKFAEAETIFSMLAQVWDKPSKTYLERCKMYIKNPPKDYWDGVWTMDSK